MLEIRRVSFEDTLWIAEFMRPEDQREAATATGFSDPWHAVVASRWASTHCYVAAQKGRKPAILFGVSPCPTDDTVGSVWLVATTMVSPIARAFLKAAPGILRAFHTEYPGGLYALADSRNDTHLRWLQLAGFMLHEQDIQVNGVPFILATHV